MDDFNKLIIPEVEVDFDLLKSDPKAFSSDFDQKGRPASVSHVSWDSYPDKPDVRIRIGWSGEFLLLKFIVKEREILGTFTQDGSDVYKDSCAEIFLSPENSDHYYNFEFNCLGTCLAQVGTQRENREILGTDILSGIRRISSLERSPYHKYHEGLVDEAEVWSLLLVIPSSAFVRDSISNFQGFRMRGNFYKCGDNLETPHYLSWNPVLTEQPDFHRPEFFGELWFS